MVSCDIPQAHRGQSTEPKGKDNCDITRRRRVCQMKAAHKLEYGEVLYVLIDFRVFIDSDDANS